MPILRHSGDRCEVWTPAKLNLFFEVLARRADGFHDIETLMVPIRMEDTLVMADDASGRVTLECRWAPGLEAAGSMAELPPAEENLALRAVRRLAECAGMRRGASMRLVKRIPAAAGLGGASSDAAAALIAANHLWQLGWTREQLADVAAQLGSDVPFFLAGGAAICRGRGEQIEPVGALPRLDVVVVKPECGLSTAEVYGNCRPADAPRSALPLLAALRRGDLAGARREMVNRLEPPAQSLCPQIVPVKRELEGLGALVAQMSGSGSSCFAICHNAWHARIVAAAMEARGLGQTWATCSRN